MTTAMSPPLSIADVAHKSLATLTSPELDLEKISPTLHNQDRF
jgi:hypothetical protein